MSTKAIRDIYKRVNMLRPAAVTATATGTAISMANVIENKIDVTPGTITDGTHTPALEESLDNTTFTAVAATDMVGTLAALASNVDQSVSYIGSKPYVRVKVTVAGATTGGVYAIGAQVKYRRQP
ncbi:MAG: hypothetical protein JWQ02_1533 [Capsulimonas sp.]|nr:hypothetical protein [Capsulimonas sp.]